MSKQKTKKFRKVSKKNKCYTKEEVEFITQVRSIKLIYLDNPLLGFKSDEEDKKKCGEDFLRWVKYQRIETVISLRIKTPIYRKNNQGAPTISKEYSFCAARVQSKCNL